MKNLYPLWLVLILMWPFACTIDEKPAIPEYRLWYNKPAEKWVEALPVGNGRLGAMVFGRSDKERIQFNEESLWAGSKINNNNPESLTHLSEVQELIFAGQYEEANKMAAKYMVGTPPRIRSYQTFGDLILDYQWKSKVKNYKRELNLNTGIANTTYEIDDNIIQQEVFTSAPHDLIIVHLSATKPINLEVALKREKDASVEFAADGTIIMKGQIMDTLDMRSGPAGAHMKFSAKAKIINEEGKLKNNKTGISCMGVKKLTIYLTAATNYALDSLNFSSAIDPQTECEKILSRVEQKSYADLKKEHIEDHRAMFDRVTFSLGKDSLSYLPTDQRLDRIKKGEIDPGLVTIYFQYGRYLLMGSSRQPGRLPANLQGIWNEHYKAPWNADFHTNINLQMNYWPAEVCNLSETSMILAAFIDKLTKPGAVTAKEMYGADGWTMHHLTDVFGRTGVADGVWGVTPLDGPWMTFPLYRHYEFTGDTAYLRGIYPIIKGSANFILDFLVESPEGYLVTNPSHSPENSFFVPGTQKKKRSALTYAATTDIQIINKLFDMIENSTEILDIDPSFSQKIKEIRQKLPPIQVGKNGTIQEWIHDYEEVEVGHRHMSHLLGLYPLAQITPETPRLYEAAKKTISRRLSKGGGHTGWSRAWIINFFARLQNADEAWKHLQLLLAKSTLQNLFDDHPPFQIDGNFGGTAGIAEMLLQSHNGTIRLLPALPQAWKEGSITGLKARRGFTCDIHWQDGQLTKAIIHGEEGGKTVVAYGSRRDTITLVPGEEYVFQ